MDGVLRRYLRDRRGRFEDLRLSLKQAGITTTFDRYLARAVRLSVLPVVAGAAAGVLLAYLGWTLYAVGVFVGGVLVGGTALGVALVYPSIRAKKRGREIDAALPYAMTVVYVLSKSGMSLPGIAEVFANSEEFYGELSVEFRRIRRDVTYYGEDLLTALENAEATTPSDEFAEFLGDLATVMSTKTEFTEFAESQYLKQQERAEEVQKSFLGRLASFAQIYVVLVFVGPVFALVLLILLSFSGADTLPVVYVTAYVYPVVGVVLAVAALDAMEAGMRVPEVGTVKDERKEKPPGDETYRRYRRAKLKRRLLSVDPFGALRQRPSLSVLVTVPVVGVVLVLAVLEQGVTPAEFYAASPVEATAAFVLTASFVAAPVAVLYRLRHRRHESFVDRIPSLCERLAEASSVGMTPVEASRVVSESVEGEVSDEMRRVHDEAVVTNDFFEALTESARRVGIAEYGLTVKTAAEATRATNDIERTLRSLAEAAESRGRLRTERRQSMELYAVVVVLGLSTFIATAVFLELFFLPSLAEVAGATEEGFLAAPPITPEGYTTVLFHATLVQAAVNGLFIGKLRDGRARAGLVYSVVFVTVASVVFLLL